MKRKKRDFADLYKVLGEKIRLARLTKGITGEELGNRLGITEQQQLKYERGEARVPLDRLIIIAQATEMSIVYFLRDFDSEDAITASKAMPLVRSTGDLVRLWQEVPTHSRPHLLAVIRNAVNGRSA